MIDTPVVAKWLLGLMIGLAGYLTPVCNVIIVVIVAITFDLITGLWAALKTGRGCKSIKLWRTVEKILLSVIVITILYATDQEIGIKAIKVHRFVAWMIVGFEVWSILENAVVISNHKVFFILKRLMKDKIKDQTGVNVDEYTEDNKS